MFARFFIDRPIFAWVIALSISLAGLLAVQSLPIEQYPTIAPPSVTINVNYPGADAATVEENVTSIIEQEMNGVENFLYMSSTSAANGTATVTVTFQTGTDVKLAQVDVQNRLSSVESRLPEEVRRQGITVSEANANFLMIVAITSPDGSRDALELGNYASTRVIDELRRVPGVGDVTLFGSEYAMRIWLDPQRLAGFNMSAAQALAAVREQNSQTAGGQLGALPATRGQQLNATIITQSRFTTPEQFSQIILRANTDGSSVRLGDVARVELGANSYDTTTRLNKRPMAGMAVQLATDANALEAGEGIKSRMEALARSFPEGVSYSIPYDTTLFVSISIEEVLITLLEAMVLVFLVMFLFLQNVRSTIIPTIVVPVALLGACVGLYFLGYSINVLTLFGMVLAIGILVDDAIVVIENVERIMDEEGLPTREATYKAMGQIVSPIIGITLVLIAVFVPMAFFPGSTGGIYRQFSVTLALSMAFSALLALTLTPALCATFLRPGKPKLEGRGVFARFNRGFARTTARYEGAVASIIVRPKRWMAIYAALIAVVAAIYMSVPTSFLPDEDQGYIIAVVQAPPGATQERTQVALEEAEDYFLAQPQVREVVAILGFSFFGSGQNAGIMFVTLKPWKERGGEADGAAALAGGSMGVLGNSKNAMIFALNPPALQELGNSSGFDLRLQDKSALGYQRLVEARNQLLGAASQSRVVMGVRPQGLEESPQLRVAIDRIKARSLGLDIDDINNTLSIAFGSAYANDFNREGRVLRVVLQADAAQRMTPEDVLALRVPNATGEMVPFSAFTKVDWTAGSPQLQRYNGFPAMTISGSAAPGQATSNAMSEMASLAAALPEGFGIEWSGLSFEEQQGAGQVPLLLGLSLLVVFLLLSALYESWSIPVAVLLVVPLGVLGALLFGLVRGMSMDVYFNIGIITIIGLSAKNAILIVEYAKELEEQGRSVSEATLEAVRLRFRPILMTSLAFILGVLPLVISTGAGAAGRNALGTGVMGGMITATGLGLFFIPLFFVVTRTVLTRAGKSPAAGGRAETLAHA
ncbi:MAG TPA: multidrug efflux RND transporter permease subunit [Sphingomonadaceae bacterium]|nr:multidrug efflux RND transporter permease subunit [Sphingomonadaceae bacterium]